MAGGIIAKVPPTWKNFATSLKHQRKEFGLAKLMGTLDVQEKARAKDTHGKGIESSNANVVQKKKQYAFRNKKRTSKGQIRSQSKQQPLRRKGRWGLLCLR